jgi:hypothetical protein
MKRERFDALAIRTARSLALALAVGLMVGSTTSARADLLQNGDFNLDVDGLPGPDFWTNWTYGDTAFAAYKTDPANDAFDFDGSAYVNAGNWGDWWTSGGGWFQTVAGTEGVPYTIGAMSASEDWDNAAGELRIIYFDAGGVELARDVRHTASYQASMPWTPFTHTSVAPVGTTSVKAELATWGARGAVLWDNVSLETASVWNIDAGGDFATTSNWVGNAPTGVDAAARFLGAITDDRTILADSAVTLGSISFANAKSYTLAGAGSLRLEKSAGLALIEAQSGTQVIDVPLTVASDAYFVASSGATLRLSKPLTVASGKSLKPAGPGTISYESAITLESDAKITFANSAHATALTLGTGARATIQAHGAGAARELTVDGLTLASGAVLDVADNSLVVAYNGGSPAAQINGYLASARNGGTWDGPGIGSSIAIPSDQSLAYRDTSTSVVVGVALKGDINFSNAVDFDDLLRLAQNYGGSGKTWASGDSDYNLVVDFDDLLALAQNYGRTTVPGAARLPLDFAADWALAQQLVPEPALLSMLGMGLALRRARRP